MSLDLSVLWPMLERCQYLCAEPLLFICNFAYTSVLGGVWESSCVVADAKV